MTGIFVEGWLYLLIEGMWKTGSLGTEGTACDWSRAVRLPVIGLEQ